MANDLNSNSGNVKRKIKRPNGAGSIFESTQKPNVIQAVVNDIKGKPHNKSFRFETDNKASYARAEVAAQKWLGEQLAARELGQITFSVHPKKKISEFLAKCASTSPP